MRIWSTFLFRFDAKNMTFRNLSVWPSDPHDTRARYLSIESYGTAYEHLSFEAWISAPGRMPANYMSWSQSEWLAPVRQRSSILGGPNNIVENSTMTACRCRNISRRREFLG